MPQISFGTAAWVDTVLDKIVRRVSDSAGLPRDKVFDYLGEPDDLLTHPPADRFVAVGLTGLPVDRGIVAGGGAAHTAFDGQLRLDVFARLATDQQFRDTSFLRDQSRGMAELVRKVVKAVQVWDGVASGATDSVFREPCRLLPQGIQFNPRKPKTGWGWARVHLGVKFRTDFTV